MLALCLVSLCGQLSSAATFESDGPCRTIRILQWTLINQASKHFFENLQRNDYDDLVSAKSENGKITLVSQKGKVVNYQIARCGDGVTLLPNE